MINATILWATMGRDFHQKPVKNSNSNSLIFAQNAQFSPYFCKALLFIIKNSYYLMVVIKSGNLL